MMFSNNETSSVSSLLSDNNAMTRASTSSSSPSNPLQYIFSKDNANNSLIHSSDSSIASAASAASAARARSHRLSSIRRSGSLNEWDMAFAAQLLLNETTASSSTSSSLSSSSFASATSCAHSPPQTPSIESIPPLPSVPTRFSSHFTHSSSSPASSPPLKPHASSIVAYLNQRHRKILELSSQQLTKSISDFSAYKFPLIAQERVLLSNQNYDKIFATAWLSETDAIFGTKDNQLLLINTTTKRITEVPLLEGIKDGVNRSIMVSSCGIHAIAINPSKTLLATGGKNVCTVAVYKLPTMEPFCVCEAHVDWIFDLKWVSDDILVSGSRDCKIAIWSMSTSLKVWKNVLLAETLTPDASTNSLSGFDSTDLDQPDRMIASMSESMSYPSLQPLRTYEEHPGKVRSLAYIQNIDTMASLCTERTLLLWSKDLRPNSARHLLFDAHQCSCMAASEQHNLFAVGSHMHISFFDPRVSRQVASISVQRSDEYFAAVRSLTFDSHNRLAIGAGTNRVSFLDIRNFGYVNITNGSIEPLKSFKTRLNGPCVYSLPESNNSHVSDIYIPITHTPAADMSENHMLPLAGDPLDDDVIYSMQYNDSRTRLLLGGGPLFITYSGHYLGTLDSSTV